ncbi:MAG: Gfo/Idh/MocA family oxidoreductase [Chloroflexi bacterium]|nr:Gfo/Idh/MocA family oxidoreductase [Chloroflexota bacterium]
MFGTGWGIRVSVPAFREAGWEVAGLWSRRPERAAHFAERLQIPYSTGDAQALIARPEIDAVAIHTPPHMHLDLCRAAFDAGKHVLCDKPFATNIPDAEAMLQAAEASGLTAMVNYEFRFAPLRQQVQRLIADGAIGDVRHVSLDLHTTNPMLEFDRPWRLDPAHGGGLLNELGSHAIDRLRQWFGELAAVSAQMESSPPQGLDPQFTSEDHISATFEFASGGIATLSMSWVTNPPLGMRIIIAGSEGTILATSPGMMLSEGQVLLGRAGDDGLTRVEPPADQPAFAAGGAVTTSARLIEAFAESIDSGQSPSPNFQDGLQSQIAIEAMRKSNATGQVVRLA